MNVYQLQHGQLFQLTRTSNTDVYRYVRNVYDEHNRMQSVLIGCKIERVAFKNEDGWQFVREPIEENCNYLADCRVIEPDFLESI